MARNSAGQQKVIDLVAAMVLVNGLETHRLSIADRGLMYGDGLFETVAVRAGRPCLWREHLERLERGAGRLGIFCPTRDLLTEECKRVVGGSSSCVLKIILTRGQGGRGYRPPQDVSPTRILTRYPAPEHTPASRDEGVAIIWCRTPLGENPYLAGFKHLNRLEQVLARAEWNDPEIAEGLMCDGRGRVISGTMSNLFLLSQGILITPLLDTCGIEGTMRARLLELAAATGFETRESDITRENLAAADGMFLTNSLIGVWPVYRLGSKRFDVGRLPRGLIEWACEAAFTPNDWRTD